MKSGFERKLGSILFEQQQIEKMTGAMFEGQGTDKIEDDSIIARAHAIYGKWFEAYLNYEENRNCKTGDKS